MKTKIIRLKFLSPVHFGVKRLSESEISFKSDTLFSALFIEALKKNIEKEFLEITKNDKLIFSDAFPYIDYEYFLPKPILDTEFGNTETEKKQFKKTKYIRYNDLDGFMEGKIDIEQKCMQDFGVFELSEKTSLQGIESEPYIVETFRFNDKSGLYIIVKVDDDSEKLIIDLLKSLELTGIGGKKSSGYGRFTFKVLEIEDIIELINRKAKRKLLISTALPKQDELENALEEANYSLIKRSGFIDSVSYSNNLVKKKDIFAFASGSIFEKSFKGDIYTIATNGTHSVYRYLKPLFLEVQ
ncbi:MAG: type III-A CRISPR-associated RAMP protein Csm4 [Clostridioides sp.]|jgi:CRISPR-associated protein Csm4|nr:type III-A CRISPR-associated RAMP protein Csm4 [Clostridioides sp.]